MLTQQDLDDWASAKSKYDLLEQKIVDRIDEIFTCIFEAFKLDRNKLGFNWWFDGAEEGEMGQLVIYHDTISYVSEIDDNFDRDSMLDYLDNIPVEYLTMTDAQIKKDVKAEIAKEAVRKKEQAAKRKAAKAKKEATIKAAKAKLSQKEKKALGIK